MSNDKQDNGDNSGGTGSYRPELSPATATELTRDLYGLHVLSCRELDSYDDRNFYVSVDVSVVDNDHIARVWPHGYVLKVLNSLDSKRPDIIDAKNRMMVQAAKKGFPTPRPVPSVSGHLSCMQALVRERGDHLPPGGGDAGEKDVYLIRLMEYLPGSILSAVPLTPQLSFQVGQYAAQLDLALKDYDDSQCPELLVDWNMQNVPSLRRFFHVIDDVEKTDVVTRVLEAFEAKVLKRESGLQKGIIHSDFNEHNILVTREESASAVRVCGILDFGDATKSFLIVEIAIVMAYMTMLCPSGEDPDEMAGHALAGYLSKIELSSAELELLPLTMCARFSQTLIFGYHRLALDPANEYCLLHARRVWPYLQRLWTRPVPDTLDIWKRVADSLGVTFNNDNNNKNINFV